MRLVRDLLIIATSLTLSVSLHIPSGVWDNGRYTSLDSRDDSPLVKKIYQHDVSPPTFLRKEQQGNPIIWKAQEKLGPEEPPRKPRKQRRSPIPPPPPENEPAREGPAETPNPTINEMKRFYSEEEIKSYIQHRRIGQEHRHRLKHMARDAVLTEEEKQQFNAGRHSYEVVRRMQDHVRGELVRTNRARPGMMKAYQRRSSKGKFFLRGRLKELDILIHNDMASPDEIKEREEILRTRADRVNEKRKINRVGKKEAEEKRLKELEHLVNDSTATEAERVEYELMVARRMEQRVRMSKNSLRYRERKKERAKANEGTQSAGTGTGSEEEGGGSLSQKPDPPNQSSSNPPLLQKTNSLLSHFGNKLWQATSRAGNRPWKIPSIPGVAPPFGFVP